MRPLLRAFRDATDDVGEAQARLERRLDLSLGAEPSRADGLHHLPASAPGEVERLERRLTARASPASQAGGTPLRGSPPDALPRPPPPARYYRPQFARTARTSAGSSSAAPARPRRGVVLAVIAAFVLAVWFLARPEPDLASTRDLVSTEPEDLRWTPEVGLTYAGTGQVSGTRRVSHIRWDFGTLTVGVRAHAGVTLDVETPEALVEVVGTAFRVTRDALGTEVVVDQGTVQVTCHHAPGAVPVSAPDHHLCVPDRPAGLLGRARALRTHDPVAALAAVERGLSHARRGDPIRGELLALKVEICFGLDRSADAIGAAQTYLDEGYTARAGALRDLVPDTKDSP